MSNHYSSATQASRLSLHQLHNAYEILDHATPQLHSNLLLTCEHASYRLPPAYNWTEHDQTTHIGTHWSYDIAAEQCTRQISDITGSIALLSRYSRLFCDPNRPVDSDTMFRTECDGQTVDLNHNITTIEKQSRIEQYYIPYHIALKQLVTTQKFDTVLSIHSYNALYENQHRKVEIGILYKQPRDKHHAESLCNLYTKHGFNAQINKPWSGMNGFMYAIDNVHEHTNNTIMLEYRNDLLSQDHWRTDVIQLLTQYLYDNKLIRHVERSNTNNDKTPDTISSYINTI